MLIMHIFLLWVIYNNKKKIDNFYSISYEILFNLINQSINVISSQISIIFIVVIMVAFICFNES